MKMRSEQSKLSDPDRSVLCDVCVDLKEPALKSCLQCSASYCQPHLRPHLQTPALRKHTLVRPHRNLPRNVCPQHQELMKVYCRTDQQCICYLCSLDQHRAHDTVPAAEERTERHRRREAGLQRRVQTRDGHLRTINREIGAFGDSADDALKEVEDIFDKSVDLIRRRHAEVKSAIEEKRRAAVIALRAVGAALEQEKEELQENQAELRALSQTQDHVHFLNHCPADPGPEPKPCHVPPQNYFRDVSVCVQTIHREMIEVLEKNCGKISLALEDVGAFLRRAPGTTEELLPYFHDIKLEPNIHIPLSEENRKAELTLILSKMLDFGLRDQPFFTNRLKVFSTEAVSGRCYWELTCSSSMFCVALTYKDLTAADQELFGDNANSWALHLRHGSFSFRHGAAETHLPGPVCSRIGLYLDHAAGMICFYGVSGSLCLLHEVRAVFSGPLHLGIQLLEVGTLEIFTSTTLN